MRCGTLPRSLRLLVSSQEKLLQTCKKTQVCAAHQTNSSALKK